MSTHPEVSPKAAFSFPGWSAALATEASLAPGLRESYRLTVSRFLQFCAGRRVAPAVAGAREFIELAQVEEAPSPARLRVRSQNRTG